MTAYIHGLVPESWPHLLVTLTEKPPQPPAHQRQSGHIGLVPVSFSCGLPGFHVTTTPLLLIQRGLSVSAQPTAESAHSKPSPGKDGLLRVLSPFWV